MNEDRWNAISEAGRAAIEALSGEALARRVGEARNAADAASVGQMTEAGIEIHDASAPIVGKVDEIGRGSRPSGSRTSAPAVTGRRGWPTTVLRQPMRDEADRPSARG